MIELLITAQAIVRAIYAEAIPLEVLGRVRIERASHVEPDLTGQWWADLSPSKGPILGPFPYRSDALQAEHDWLRQHVLFGPAHFSTAMENVTHETIPAHQSVSTSISSPNGTFQTTASDPDL